MTTANLCGSKTRSFDPEKCDTTWMNPHAVPAQVRCRSGISNGTRLLSLFGYTGSGSRRPRLKGEADANNQTNTKSLTQASTIPS